MTLLLRLSGELYKLVMKVNSENKMAKFLHNLIVHCAVLFLSLLFSGGKIMDPTCYINTKCVMKYSVI